MIHRDGKLISNKDIDDMASLNKRYKEAYQISVSSYVYRISSNNKRDIKIPTKQSEVTLKIQNNY